jgi:hypothetical protein
MKTPNDINFKAGQNIAMKVPAHQYEHTVKFYREIIGLPQIKNEEPQIVFKFGDKKLWIDKEKHLSQAEIWLELECDNIDEAKKHFRLNEVSQRDGIEKLPRNFKAFWISSPSDIIHLINEQ